jgi:hypothetical protein
MKYIENKIRSINTIAVNSKRCSFCYSKIEPEMETNTIADFGHSYGRYINITKGYCKVFKTYRQPEAREVIKFHKRFSYKASIDIYYVCSKCDKDCYFVSIDRKSIYV